ncbi:MAG: oligosaccharide flippase family protein [Clostridia bacterium]|nr:oligosaccharide flippase family protein [Clostridia bacterium]
MRKFFKAVAIVTVFSVCEKFLGFLYRVYLSRAIGAEGVGAYQVALSVFAFLLTVICSGTPVTLSRLMTKYRSENGETRIAKAITAAIAFTLLVAVPVCVICYLLGDNLSFLFADKRSLKVFFIILPGLIFTSVYSVLRGVFWGNKDFLPYSVIELLEEICMITVGIVVISVMHDKTNGALGAGVAVTASYVLSFLLATAVFFARKNKLANPKSEFKPLIKASAPVTAMRTVNSLAVSLVSVVLPHRLIAAGFTESKAMELFGSAAGQAIPLLFIPTTLIGSFTLVLIPEISENYYFKRNAALKSDVEKAVKFASILTCLFIPVFFVCGEQIGIIIFDSYNCGKYLTASAFLMLFMSLSGITTSILNSIGCEVQTLLFCVASGVFMLTSIWFLPAYTGIYALLIGFSFVYVITTILNIVLLRKKCPEKPKTVKYIFCSALITLPTILLGEMLKKLLLKVLGVFFTFAVCSAAVCVFYCLLAVGFNLVNFDVIKAKTKTFLRGKKRVGAKPADA